MQLWKESCPQYILTKFLKFTRNFLKRTYPSKWPFLECHSMDYSLKKICDPCWLLESRKMWLQIDQKQMAADSSNGMYAYCLSDGVFCREHWSKMQLLNVAKISSVNGWLLGVLGRYWRWVIFFYSPPLSSKYSQVFN